MCLLVSPDCIYFIHDLKKNKRRKNVKRCTVNNLLPTILTRLLILERKKKKETRKELSYLFIFFLPSAFEFCLLSTFLYRCGSPGSDQQLTFFFFFAQPILFLPNPPNPLVLISVYFRTLNAAKGRSALTATPQPLPCGGGMEPGNRSATPVDSTISYTG